MRPPFSYLVCSLAFAALAVAPSAEGDINTGQNAGGPLASESQIGSPVGQTDFQTDPFTGRFSYVVPFDLAPSRHNNVPNIELRYNSANGNGTCGAGWDIDVGYIERETQYGIPVTWSGGKPASPMTYDDNKGFLFSFKNKTSDLVSLGSGSYRAQTENDFLKFQYYSSSNTWVIFDKSGNQYNFGSTAASRMTNPKSTWSTSGDAATFRWALDSIVTATGDKATITYTSAGGRLYPSMYSYNGHTAGIIPTNVLRFYWATRPDATISCRSAYAVTNLYRLNAVAHTVNTMMVWSNQLNYTPSPSTGRSMLASITRYGTNLSSALPTLTFNYSQQSFSFQGSSNWGSFLTPPGTPTNSLYLYYSFNNPFCDLIDVDGDGLPDRVFCNYTTPTTNWWVQHNNGSTGFGTASVWKIESQTYSNNYTSNYLTWAQPGGSHGRVIDMNGDGRPDFIVDPLAEYFNGGNSNAMRTNYSWQQIQLNSGGTNLVGQVSWTNVNDQVFNNSAGDTEFREVESPGLVALLDMNGDGLPDRVMVQPQTPFTYYYVQFNTTNGFGPTNMFGPFHAQGYSNDMEVAGLAGNEGFVESGGAGASMRMLDINGDGLPDRVMIAYYTSGGSGPLAGPSQTYYVVELNNGYGFEPAINWTNVDPLHVTCGGGTLPGIGDVGDDYQVALRDINGDGLPDRIVACYCSSSFPTWLVQINTGMGFMSVSNWPVTGQNQTGNANFYGIQTTFNNVGYAMLLDMNGDGLPDRVEYSASGSANYVVELSSGPFPDLMTVASNGLGGVVTATYQPSTKYDNRQLTNGSATSYLLPFPMHTVSSVSVGDGIYPNNTTTYSYSGGYWSPSLRQFNGFVTTTVTDPLGMETVHWFHQAGGRDNSSFGEYADTNAAIGKEGMEFRTDIIGTNGQTYKTTLNKVVETLPNSGEHFGYVAQTIDMDYYPGSSTYRAAAKNFSHDLGNGNLTNTFSYGEVNTVSPQNWTFNDVSTTDDIYQITRFATFSANANILDKPKVATVSTDSAGNNILRQTSYVYDTTSAANLLQQLDVICESGGTPQYRTNSYTYDSSYNIEKTHTDPAGITTQTTYETTYQTYPSQIVEGGTLTTSTTYDPRSGKLTQSTSPTGLVTANTYDPFLRLLETDVSLTANGSPTHWIDKYTYTLGVSGGRPQNSIFHYKSDGVDLSNGHEVFTYFDGLGRTAQLRQEGETNGVFRVTDTVYDRRGSIEYVSFPYYDTSGGSAFTLAATSLGTFKGYDPIGRLGQISASSTGTFNGSGQLTSVSGPNGDTGSPVSSSTMTYYYTSTSDPWTLVVTDEAGKTHRYVLDAYGRTNQVVEVTGNGNYTTSYNWNLASDLLSVVDSAPTPNTIEYSNNLVGEVVAMADPDMSVWQYELDFAGRVHRQIDGDNQTNVFNYTDALGRLVSRQLYDLKGNFYYGVTNVYDSNGGDSAFPVAPGQLYKTIDAEGYTKYGYDIRNRKIISARYLSKNGKSYTNQYSYDDMDRVTSIVYPNGGPTINDTYDHAANLSQVQQSGGTTFYTATAFSPPGQIAAISYGSGAGSTYGYYANSKRLQSAITTKSGNLQSLSYTYDAVGDVASIVDNVYSGASSAAVSSITTDDLYRLVSFVRGGVTYHVGCDSVGNLVTNTENGSVNYSYSGRLPHAVKSANSLNYAYDLCGNMLVRGGQSLVYSPDNRLIAAVSSNQVTTFGYAADGTRLWKQGPGTNTLQVWIDGNYEERNGKTLFHVSAGNRIVYTVSSDSAVADYYVPDHLHSTEFLTGQASVL